jgi:putative PIN family toxin of toxin-antitoxin system
MGRVQSVTCREILEEFREKLLVKFTYSSQSAQAALDEVQKCSRLVTITGKLKAVSADPDDDMVLECALVGGATYIVTGDRHLLALGSFQGILIVKATDFLAMVS